MTKTTEQMKDWSNDKKNDRSSNNEQNDWNKAVKRIIDYRSKLANMWQFYLC